MVLESRQALKLWQAVSAETKRVILGNVWCSECRTSVTICDYSAHLKGDAVVLQGFCAGCGHKVARVVEGCVPSVKRAKPVSAGLYIFDVWLWGDAKCTIKNRIARKIQISGAKSLYQFAEVITQAFKSSGEKMIFFFDYGDSWQFEVELKEIKTAGGKDPKAVVLEKIGEAPLQYPPCEDEVEE